jgi:hypothetical protein
MKRKFFRELHIRVILFSAMVFLGKSNAFIVSYEKEVYPALQGYPSISLYPIGYNLYVDKLDISLRTTISNSLGLDLGIQSNPFYSSVGLYMGPRFQPTNNELGFSSTIIATALICNLSIQYEYINKGKIKLGIGVGLPYVWYLFRK